jgi:hypothetical protein
MISKIVDASRYTISIRARRLRGAAALMETLECIGHQNRDDHDMAKIMCDEELELRELLSFALLKLSKSDAD